MLRSTRFMISSAAVAAVAVFSGSLHAQTIPAGDLVIINTSNTPAAGNGDGHFESVELQAYNVTGATPSLDATIPLPGVTLMTNIDDDRHLKLSVDGTLVTLAGYNAAQAPAGTVAPGAVGDDALYSSPAASVNREVVSVDASGHATYVNLGSNLYDTSEITGAITVNGSQYYLSGEPQNANDNNTYAGAGPQYVSLTPGTNQVTKQFTLYDPDAAGGASASARSVSIHDGQLYYTTGSSSFGSHGVLALGAGLTVPTTNLGLTATLLSGQGSSPQSVNDVAFLDLTGNGEPDVEYTAAKNGIAKYINTSTTGNIADWVAAGVITSPNEMKEITAEDVNGVVDIFAVDGAGNLFKVADTTPATDSLSGALLTTYTPYISAANNYGGTEFFGGVALAPVPEPTSLSLLALGSGALLARRRRRMA